MLVFSFMMDLSIVSKLKAMRGTCSILDALSSTKPLHVSGDRRAHWIKVIFAGNIHSLVVYTSLQLPVWCWLLTVFASLNSTVCIRQDQRSAIILNVFDFIVMPSCKKDCLKTVEIELYDHFTPNNSDHGCPLQCQ